MRNAERQFIPVRRWQRGASRILMAASALALALTVLPGYAGRGKGPTPGAQDQIEDLPVCYALGTDAIGRAVNAAGGQALDSKLNLSDPDFAEGLSYYRRCFAKDFSFTLLIDGAPILTIPDPTTRTPDTDAALQWANFVNNTFRDSGYRNTQHLMGSITSTVEGNSGTSQAYVIATHAYAPISGRTGTNVVGGTYSDEVVRERGTWRTAKRSLNVTSSVDVPAGL